MAPVKGGSGVASVGLMVMLAMAFLLSLSEAAQYTIQWDLDHNENSWYPGKIFNIGDQLVFKYDNTKDNVVEVTLDVYASCSGIPNANALTSGNDVVTLLRRGDYYFVSGLRDGRCGAGMRLHVTVA